MTHPASPFTNADRFYEAIVHSLGGIVWAADPETFHFSFVSEQAERILGYPVRQWLDEPDFWRRHTHPDDVDRCTAFCRDATRKGRDHTFEYRMLAADGRIVWLRDIVTVRPRSERPQQLVGIMFDVTAQKDHEAEQRERDDLYRVLADNTSDVITLYDLSARRVYASPSFRRTFGVLPEAAFGGIHPEDLPGVKDTWSRVRHGDTLTVSFRHIDGEGTWRWVEARGSMVDYRGEPHVLAVTRDLTDRRRLEEQLRQAQKLEAIGLLAGGVAHDFNNLLTVILGYADLLGELVSEPHTQSVVAEIQVACDRAVLLTQQLLAFSRKQVLHPSVIDLPAVVQELANMLRRLIGESIELTVSSAGDVPPVLADVGQVQQVVTNLAVNARDAMPGGGRLTIETSAVEIDPDAATDDLPAGRYAVVSMTDTGTGMSPEVAARIFEPFFTTKEPGKGTGLGLSTAYGIVKQSGGHIDLRSKPGAGSIFTLYFPETAVPPERPRTPDDASAPRGTEIVLLVEDEEQVRSLVSRALQKGGYQVRSAENGMDALEIARSSPEPISLLVTDVVMPGMSGPELVHRLASVRPGLRVLYISGYAGDSVLRDAGGKGAAFLQKPFAARDLLAKVRQVLDRDVGTSASGDAS